MAKHTRIAAALKQAQTEASRRERQAVAQQKQFRAAEAKMREGGPTLQEIAAHHNLRPNAIRSTKRAGGISIPAFEPASRPARPKRPVTVQPPPSGDDFIPYSICFFPASEGFVPSDPGNVYDAPNASLQLHMESSNVPNALGFTLGPIVTDARWAYLRYAFFLPHDGILTALAAVWATGRVLVTSQPRLWTPFSWAEAEVVFNFSIWQDTRLVARDSEVVCKLHCDPNSSDSRGYSHDAFPKICAGYVTDGSPVIVEFQVAMTARGNSDSGYAEIDFTKNGGIQIPEMCVFLGPPVPTIVL
jgi:hypothetical protein